ncbi:hypothetical protein ACLB2K_054070 [Fragaria x ananassa]
MEYNGELIGHQSPLPADIIVEILARLTVKSLCRFRCVSKPWRSLISNTKFIALHDRKALEDKHVYLGRRRVIFTVPISQFYCFYSLDLDEFLTRADDHDGLVMATKLDFVHQELSADDFWNPHIYACNNLLLLYNVNSGWHLVNPATREIRKVAETPSWWMIRGQFEPRISMINGFGFDCSTNEYKVVMGLSFFKKKDDDIEGVMFSVYTLETDSWRTIEYLFPYCPQNSPGFFLNGAVHWLGMSTVGDGDGLILSLLLAEEVVREIQLPLLDDSQYWSARLGVFRDCLCITFKEYKNGYYDEFWVMKEYGSFVMYNFKEDSFRRICDITEVSDRVQSVGTYVEGLVPLSTDNRLNRSCRQDESSIKEARKEEK